MLRSLMAAALLVACSKSAAPPKPFTGKLTIDRLKSLTMQSVPVCAGSWDEDFAKVQARVGVPTKIEGNNYYWAVKEGDRCAIVSVERGECPPSWNKPGARLVSATDPMETTATSTTGNHDKCVRIASDAP